MKKKLRLNESELIELVKKIIQEQEFDYDMVSSFSNSKRGGEPEVIEKKNTLLLKNNSEEEISQVLSNIPSDIQFLSIIDGEFADFGGVDLCSSNIMMLRLLGTPSNFNSQEFPCVEEELGGGIFSLSN